MSERIPLDPNLFGEDQLCFGCGPRNDVGMQLKFFREGDDTVTTTFTPRPGWDGPPGIVHGGLQATLADEVGAWTVMGIRGFFGFTASLQLRYLRPARSDQPIEATGRVTDADGGRTVVRLELRQDGRKLLTGTATYMSPTVPMAEKILGQPLPDAWRPLARPEE